jgi:nucleoid DNA-binding protein
MSATRAVVSGISDQLVNLVFDSFTDSLKNGDRNAIRGFGSFSVREYRPNAVSRKVCVVDKFHYSAYLKEERQ